MTSALGTIAHTASRHCARRARSSVLPPTHSVKDRMTRLSLGSLSQGALAHPSISSDALTLPAAHNGDGVPRLPAQRSPSRTLVAGSVAALDRPSPATDGFSSGDNKHSNAPGGAADAPRAKR